MKFIYREGKGLFYSFQRLMIKKIETGTAPYAGIHFLRFSERTKMWGPYAGLKNSGDIMVAFEQDLFEAVVAYNGLFVLTVARTVCTEKNPDLNSPHQFSRPKFSRPKFSRPKFSRPILKNPD
jgi:hypothetical protein